ncbi:PhnD/SsuA/transferrin family substrate-binding protein [Aliihoeflea sp. 2WW]|uniref:phosphate/phosphite/phosphonate ABC transporter substrate-binding protein n=1 Tax=Aliihoeflea sp. 2WW TaxID=1381123 RepID=UPI0004643179|nr:PhnD/SsuA/transferrin family substrate-binding protein [Aliihoeflea sp. 2WW]
MTDRIAALPMYDWPEVRAQTNAQWTRIREILRTAGIDAHETLTRETGDLYDFWRRPELLFAQTCWGPMGDGLAEHVHVIGQPDYSDVEGGEGEFYRSVVLMRRNDDSLSSGTPPSVLSDISPSRGEINLSAVAPTLAELTTRVISPPEGEMSGRTEGGVTKRLPSITSHQEAIRNKRLAYNVPDSMSGYLALQSDLGSLDLFSEHISTGGHRASIRAVASNHADVCAIDCRSWALAQRHEPAAANLIPIGWTTPRKGLPYITSRQTPPETVAAMRAALMAAGLIVA